MLEGYIPPPITEEELRQAKDGTTEFASVLQTADDDARRFLVQMRTGRQLQAMFLGLKPACSLTDDSQHKDIPMVRQLGYISHMLSDKFQTVDNIVYESQTTASLIRTRSGIFPGAPSDPEKTGAYLRSVYSSSMSPQRHVQLGVLFGFPDQAITSYVRFNQNADIINRLLKAQQGLTDAERTAVLKLDNPLESEVSAEDRSLYLSVLSRQFPQLTEFERQAFASAQVVELPGFFFGSYGHNPQVESFKFKVKTIFELSGMNEVVRRNK